MNTSSPGSMRAASRQNPPRLVVVAGPTAVGKSDLALDLARELGAEIINADSMQLYQGMDIGTAKLSDSEREGIPHHLLDIWPIEHEANVSEYQQLARAQVEQLHRAGKSAVLVGGSGLYINAVIDNLEFPGTDQVLREQLYRELEATGPAPLYSRLQELDPKAAASMEPNNARRIIRALEVIEITGKPYTAKLPRANRHFACTVIGLTRDRVDLDQRIETRVEQMWANGLLAEIAHLREQGLDSAPTAAKALGYAQGIAQLRGELSEDAAKTDTATATRRFARRQLSWFRRDPQLSWLEISPGGQEAGQGASSGGQLLDQAMAVIDQEAQTP